MRINWIEPISRRVETAAADTEHWLWCIECSRFFPLERVVIDGTDTPRCPFSDCFGHGFDFNLFYWDSQREPADPRWPRSTAELEYGQRSPDMEPFYAARLQERIRRLVDDFRAADGGPVAYVGAFLKMMSDLCWDLTEPDDDEPVPFDAELAREVIDQLPVWSQTRELPQAAVMLDELRRFFTHAHAAGTIPHADEWAAFVADPTLIEILQYTMQNDRRLQQRMPRLRVSRRGGKPARRKRRHKRKRSRQPT